MKKDLVLLTCILLLASCSGGAPSGNEVGTAVSMTLTAQSLATHRVAQTTSNPALIVTNIQPPTRTPKPTFDRHAYETQVFATAAAKPTTHRPTITSIPKTTYILETGWCMLDVSIDEVSGKDPKTVQWCNLDAREQIELALGQYMELTLNNLDGGIQVYCALFSLDGTFIMSDMDTTGSGKVNCPHE